MLWPAVYLTLTFKSYTDAPKELLQLQMNRRFKVNSTVHQTPLFGLHSTAPSGCSSAPDSPMVCRCIYWVTGFNGYISAYEWPDDLTPAQWDTISSSDGTTFQENFSNG
jgi:hypothetical protein